MTIIWRSTVTQEMVSNLDEDQIAELIESLDDAVANICEELVAE